MSSTEIPPESSDVNRREFIRHAASVGTLMVLAGGVPLGGDAQTTAAEGGETKYSTVSAPLSFGVIGCNIWGREILQTLARLPNAPVVAVCDKNAAALRRAKETAPNAEGFSDYRELLKKKEVQGVVVATPSHLHREIVLAALAAGKHVYCEAPLASSIDDARAIAQAARDAVKLNFQSGLQNRSDPQRFFLLPFVRSGAAGQFVMARAHWFKKDSWRRASGDPAREKELNWRLDKATSAGLLAEVGIHQLDGIAWLLNKRPQVVTGFSGILKWNDGRDVPDTVHAILEYPGGGNLVFEGTLANSFDSNYEIFHGSDGTILLRESKAWLFEEADAPLLGWETYARKDKFYEETGIALVANASKLQKTVKPGEKPPPEVTPLEHALAAFVTNSGVVATGVQDFTTNFGDDPGGLREYLAGPTIARSRRAAAGYVEGFEATVTALKANEAVVQKQRLTLTKEMYDI